MTARTNNVSLTFALYRGGQLVRRLDVAQDVVKIGADPKCHLVVDDELASRMHAVMEVATKDDITLIDLGNEPGTRVNGTRVNKCKLQPGDQVQIGGTVLALESATITAPSPKLNPFAVAPTGLANPFAAPAGAGAFAFSPLATPFAAPAVPQARDSGADLDGDALGPHTYALLKSGPDVNADEVEMAHTSSIEVMVLWGSNVLHVDHLTPPRSYFVGEKAADKLGCDYFLPCETLGTTRAPIVVARAGEASLVILPRSTGSVEIPGTGRVTFADLIASGRARASSELSGAYELELPAGAKARMELPDSQLVFQISAVNAGKPVPVGVLAQFEPAAHGYFGLSLLLHMSLVASVAFFMPSLGADDAEAQNRDQILMMQHMLTASATHEQDARELEETADNKIADKEGGTGAQAKNEEGSMGNRLSHETGHKYGVEGPKDNADPHLSRQQQILQAKDFGMIGILNAGGGGDPNAPTAPWGRDDSSGNDPKSALGNMWGDSIGEAFGAGGLGLSGDGEGGGGKNAGIGMGDIGTIGHGRGTGDNDGFGNGHGPLHGTYHTHAVPRMIQGDLHVNGRLPAEVIQRIVRQNFGRFRMCYEDGLRQNPTLQGRVGVKFAIDRGGAVSLASDGGSDLPDHAVVQCVVRGFSNLSFPEPQGGIVTVVYPLVFSPGS